MYKKWLQMLMYHQYNLATQIHRQLSLLSLAVAVINTGVFVYLSTLSINCATISSLHDATNIQNIIIAVL